MFIRFAMQLLNSSSKTSILSRSTPNTSFVSPRTSIGTATLHTLVPNQTVVVSAASVVPRARPQGINNFPNTTHRANLIRTMAAAPAVEQATANPLLAVSWCGGQSREGGWSLSAEQAQCWGGVLYTGHGSGARKKAEEHLEVVLP